MQFKIENIGIILSADVKLDGLTVIGGENDTGKSTVGKLLFAIIKGIARYEQDLKENREENLNRAMEDIYLFFRRFARAPHDFDAFNLKTLRVELSPFIEESQGHNLLPENEKLLDKFFEEKTQIIENTKTSPFNSINFKKQALQKLQLLRDLLYQESTRDAAIKRALRRAFNSEFYGELSPRHQPKSASQIALSEGETPIFKIGIKGDDIETFELTDLLSFEDVTFLESPILLQMYDVVRYADTLLDLQSDSKESRLQSLSRPKVSLHLKDAMNKMANARFFDEGLFTELSEHNDLLNKIASIMGGEISFEKELRDFVFKKKHNGGSKKIQVRAANTASGIKSFGMIQLLVQAGFVDRRSLLIIDEPETHLHPKWQVEYARLLVELVKAEIPVLLTSHSPYMVQALKVFSEKAGIADLTNFYLSESVPKSPGTVIQDVTNDLNRLFQKLSEPLQQLVWE